MLSNSFMKKVETTAQLQLCCETVTAAALTSLTAPADASPCRAPIYLND